MGTKQLRLSDPEQIRKRIDEFVGKQINIVLTDSTVAFGTLEHVNATGITLQNMRLKKTTYPFVTLTEIYFDTNA
jgi:acetyl-CoA carboxylase carboxyltransferase component